MKILILTSAFPPEAEGAATHLPEMAAALQKQGHRILVVAVVNRHEVRDSLSFRVKRISRSQVRLIRDLRVLIKLIREGRRCGAFYVYGIWWQAALASLITGVPLVVKFTGDKVWEQAVENNQIKEDLEEFQQSSPPLKTALLHSLYRFWARFSTHFVVSCDTLLRVLMSWGISRSKIEIIPNALPQNPRDDQEATYLAQWKDQQGLRLITAGHLKAAKQLDQILGILARFDNMRWIVAGDGPDLQRIKNLTTQMNLTDRVLFTGKVSRQDLAGYVNECDILILNSRIGRFNYVIPEALARGKLILATRRGLHGDFIEHGVNGFLYTNNQMEELYQILSDIQAQRSLVPPREITAAFPWNKQVELIEDLLVSCQR